MEGSVNTDKTEKQEKSSETSSDLGSRRDNGNNGALSPLCLRGSLTFLCMLYPELPQRREALISRHRPQAGKSHARDVMMDRLLIGIVILV